MSKRSKARRREQHRAAVLENISRLMDQAVAEPGEADPMGMVGFGATLAAAMLYIRQEETDRARGARGQVDRD